MHKRSELGVVQWFCLTLWFVVLVAFVVLLSREGIVGSLSKDALPLGELKVYCNSGWYATWTREKAVEFSIEKLANVVNYLLLATAAVLAFAVKAIMEERSQVLKRAAASASGAGTSMKPMGRLELLLFLHGGIGCFMSLICGIAAYLYLPSLATDATFSIYNELQICVASQITLLLVALSLVLIGLGRIVRDMLS